MRYADVIRAMETIIDGASGVETPFRLGGVVTFAKVRFAKWRDANKDELPACLIAPIETVDADAQATTSEEYETLVVQLHYVAELPDDDPYAETLTLLDNIAVEALKAARDQEGVPWNDLGFGTLVWDDEGTPDQAMLVRTVYVHMLEPVN